METKPYPQIPVALTFLLIIIAVVNALAITYHWYWVMRWFDIPMHFAGGMWLGGMGIWWFFKRKNIAPSGFLGALAVSVSVAFGIGFGWELYEAVVSSVTVGHMNDVLDTLGDLFFDIMGGMTVALLWQSREKFNTTSK